MNTAVLLTTTPATRVLRYDGRNLGTPIFNADYVRRLADCDEQTERHFTLHFGDLLKIKLRSRLRSHQAIDDVRQETFLRVFRNLRKDPGCIRNPEQLGAYVNAVCNNVLLELFRFEGRFRNWDAVVTEPADDRVDTAGDYVTAERKRQVAALLEELPKKDRELLKQVFLEERDKDEVCREYRVDRNYLRVLLHRARVRFKANVLKSATARI
ncbi:MAG: sigma-70 family RNA polymerase sigma factor [Acidobacteriota bacterium]|nr:sigma-70 family RNA polymerase sigma factor [Acidobacteriota bacterium]